MFSPTRVAFFWSRVSKTDGCWCWTGRTNHHGYGMVQMATGAQFKKAHRVMMEMITETPLVAGQCVLHTCDNTSCVRPDHLYIGSMRDNTNDRDSRGRYHRWYAASHPRAKLTEDQVREIRLQHATGCGLKAIGARFGISSCSVWNIATRRSWKDLK